MSDAEADLDAVRAANYAAAAADTTPPGWWWLSFADPDLPEGTQFLGAALVEAPNMIMAVDRAHRLGINPGGEVAGWGPIPEAGIPEGHPREVLMDRWTIARYE